MMVSTQFTTHSRPSSSTSPNPTSKVVVDDAKKPVSAEICARERAEEIQRNLDPAHPSFVKSMVRSNVDSNFILGIPVEFCNLYLPKHNTTITLRDEDKEAFTTTFIFEHKGYLSAGWRGFSTCHKLVEGDSLIFELVMASTFQVYIIRAYTSSGGLWGLGLQSLDDHAKQSESWKRPNPCEKAEQRPKKTIRLSVLQRCNTNIGARQGEKSEKTSDNVPKVNLERPDFDVAIKGLKKKSELSEHTWSKYYELCRSQNTSLHEDLLKQHYNGKLVEGVIIEMVNTADAIEACKPSTTKDEFTTWDEKLKAFELLGMNVGFLRAKLQRLMNFDFEKERELYLKRRREAKVGHARMKRMTC
ncbi:hypothetical protein GIB67_018331 [Kingdonia uniflora]|uniref:TF-B3 domain-containing protein n=1 Tax=Kingdonia uniflora TaxID=39325 RepID=A0A7J7MJD5_9MAGN|nr:hypothetical protein GIB67_018331 [Kingdonia uniflora]